MSGHKKTLKDVCCYLLKEVEVYRNLYGGIEGNYHDAKRKYVEKSNELKDANDRIKSKDDRIEHVERELGKVTKESDEYKNTLRSLINLVPRGKINYMYHPLRKKLEHLYSTIKSREAEAKSYRDMYNEVKGAILRDYSTPETATHKHTMEVIAADQRFLDDSDKELTKLENWRKKYRRLVACINTYKGSITESILKEHRANEAKLKKRNEKQATVKPTKPTKSG